MGRLGRAPLLSNPELESAIADFPYDEERWTVLEDWLLEQDDPRAILVRLEKAGRHDAAARVRRHLHPQLLGPMHEQLAVQLYRANWRAGYLREVHCTADTAALAQAPAARILRALTLTTAKARPALAAIAKGIFVKVLHDLTISSVHGSSALGLGTASLAPFTRLRCLALRGAYIKDPAQVPRIRRLTIAPTTYDIEELGPFASKVRFPEVTDLRLDFYNMGHPQIAAANLEALLDARFAPLITNFEVRCATSEIARTTLRILAVSPLLAQLETINLGPVEGHESVRQEYGDQFERVRVTLPPD